jgi:hypothetical protein
MSKNIRLITFFLLLFSYFSYERERAQNPVEVARKEAKISCFFDSLVASEWSDEIQHGCMVRHGFLERGNSHG